jgi:3-phenylpropionate/trans-cinnamate dioxygenase ferredoxin reductase subunit
MSIPMQRVVVVGASLAGVSAARALRDLGFDGEIVVVGAEPHQPYDRPPLSKRVLDGSRGPDDLTLRAAEALEVDWRLGEPAVALDAANRVITLASGVTLTADGVVIATGSAPVRPAAWNAVSGLHYLRTIEDGLALRDELTRPEGRVVIIGAGLIGCEVAATARGMGREVTVIDPLTPCLRSVGEYIGQYLLSVHRGHGVDARIGVTVAGLDGARGHYDLRLSDGSRLQARSVVVAVGAKPETRWLSGSGLAIDDGVICDASCVAAPGVVAAGDVARWVHPRDGLPGTERLEHWDNAIEQARHAAASLLSSMAGLPTLPYRPVPWFWSEQFNLRVQVAGWPAARCEVDAPNTDFDAHKVFAHYSDGSDIIGVVGINKPLLVNEWRANHRAKT